MLFILKLILGYFLWAIAYVIAFLWVLLFHWWVPKLFFGNKKITFFKEDKFILKIFNPD